MKISRFVTLLGIALALLTSAQHALAKGPADTITIKGPGSSPVNITDPQALQEFSPWDDRFMDASRGTLSEPPHAAKTYQVTIEVKPQWIYRFDYVPDPSGGRGYIYLPGPGDKRYQMNIGTIIRTQQDGHWLYASQEWEALMQRVLKQPGAFQASDAPNLLPLTGGIKDSSLIWAAAFGGWLLVLGLALLHRARTHT